MFRILKRYVTEFTRVSYAADVAGNFPLYASLQQIIESISKPGESVEYYPSERRLARLGIGLNLKLQRYDT